MNLKILWKECKIALGLTIILAIIFCGLYPISVFAIAQILFPYQANGSLVRENGIIIGSTLIGQNFSKKEYFHPRPSLAGAGYDAANSGASNLGPISQRLIGEIKKRVDTYTQENHLPSEALIPADAVSASASGLDPYISLENAEIQLNRVARERNLKPEEVQSLVLKCTDKPDLGFLGEPGVNVFKLNHSLDKLSALSTNRGQ